MSGVHSPKSILILDDDADMRKLLRVYLGKLFTGIDIEEYDPVARGAPPDDFDWSRYDVLILDYYLCLHGVTGLDILHANRKNPEFPTTIMLTGAGNEEVAVRALKAGVYDYLRKQSLDKSALQSSIVSAYARHQQERERRQEATRQGNAFNKSLFYQQLEQRREDPGFRDRQILLIELDNHEYIVDAAGELVRDNIIRHIAKEAFEIFRLGDCNPSVTRIGDAWVALLIDNPESRRILEFNLKGLISHLEKRPYRFNEKKYRFTVSVGVCPLPGDGTAREEILENLLKACDLAGHTEERYLIVEPGMLPLVVPPPPETADELSGESDTGDAVPVLDFSVPVTEPTVQTENAATTSAADEQPVPDTDLMDRVDVAIEPIPEAESSVPDTATATEEPELALQEAAGPESIPDAENLTEPKNEVEPPAIAPVSVEETVAPPPVPRPVEKTAAPVPAAVSAAAPAPAPAAPRRSLDELKAELARAKAAPTAGSVAAAVKKPVPRPDTQLNLDNLDDAGKALKQAIDEKRVVQMYCPVISLLNEEIDNDDEIHSVSLQQIERDGTVRNADEIRAAQTTPELQKYMDRWLLKEVIGLLVNREKTTYSFVVCLRDASLADAGFFTWLRTLLNGLDKRNPGRNIVIEIDCKDLGRLEKQAGALIAYLRKTYEFKFVLGNIEKPGEIIEYTGRIQFDFVRCNHSIINDLQGMTATLPPGVDEQNSGKTWLEVIKSRGTRFIADDIGDATALTEAISTGTEYAMGCFIGEATSQLDDMTNIETFEIG